MIKFSRTSIVSILLLLTMFLSSCSSSQMKSYYSEKTNYIAAEGTVTYIYYDTDASAIYFGFSDLTPSFDDSSFKIVGNNVAIVQNNNLLQKIQIGDHIEFVSAPKYFGDGYVMPIVSITANGETLLDFEEGLKNLLAWLEQH